MRIPANQALELHYLSIVLAYNLNSDMHKIVPSMHAGMVKKPLVPYSPTSYRNRLVQPSVVMPQTNSSQIVIGDRVNAAKRQFVSINKNHFVAHDLHFSVSNPGILAERTKWVHSRELK